LSSLDKATNSCLIVGAGPAGLAPLVAAAHAGKLEAMLAAGIVIVEQGDSVGAGSIGSYSINSDSAAEAFLDAVMRTQEPQLVALQDHPIVVTIRKCMGQSIPLTLASAYLHLVGETLCQLVAASPRGLVLTRHTAVSAKMTKDGLWTTRVRSCETGEEREICTSSIVLATGAHQPLSRLQSEKVAGVPLLPTYSGKVFQSGYILTTAGQAEVSQRLRSKAAPKVVIVGGSTSAGAVARVLLEQSAGVRFGRKAVTLMHRRPLRIFYNTAEEALLDGYTDFDANDICKVSGRVYRQAGFRFESRELMMRAMQVGGRSKEPRLQLHSLHSSDSQETLRLLDEAHIIVAALGYRPRALPVFSEDDRLIELNASSDSMQPLINDRCQVLSKTMEPIRGLYAIGLASGFVPYGPFGGEASFKGQANSLWLWQHDVGCSIVDAVASNHRATLKSSVPLKFPQPVASLNRLHESATVALWEPSLQAKLSSQGDLELRAVAL
jgi:hypothetical protein